MPRKPKPDVPPPLLPWDRRPEETERGWHSFTLYREQSRPRSLRRLAREMGTKDASHLRQWSAKHDWISRVAAWDADQDRLRMEGARDEAIEAGRRQAQHAAAQQAALIQPAQELLRRIQAERAAGRNPFDGWDMHQLVRAVTAAARAYPGIATFERLARGLSTTNVGGHDGGPVQHEVADARERAAQMSRPELEAYLLGVSDGQLGA